MLPVQGSGRAAGAADSRQAGRVLRGAAGTRVSGPERAAARGGVSLLPGPRGAWVPGAGGGARAHPGAARPRPPGSRDAGSRAGAGGAPWAGRLRHPSLPPSPSLSTWLRPALAPGGTVGARGALPVAGPPPRPPRAPPRCRRARSPPLGPGAPVGLACAAAAGERVSARGGRECRESPLPGAPATQSQPAEPSEPEPEPEPERGRPAQAPRAPRSAPAPPLPAPTPCAEPRACLGRSGLPGGCHSGSSEPPAASPLQPPPAGAAIMNPQCARCGKVVYPTEKVNCLDKVSLGAGCTCSGKFGHRGCRGQSGSVWSRGGLAQGQGVADHAWRQWGWSRRRLLSGCRTIITSAFLGGQPGAPRDQAGLPGVQLGKPRPHPPPLCP